MRNRTTFLAMGLAAIFATGCSADDVPQGDDESAVSGYDDVMAGAPDNSTLPDENKADAVYPPLFTELLASQSPVKSQGSRGVCSIFATAALMEHLYLRAGMADADFSEQFLQWSVKNEVGDFTNTDGSNAASNLEAISEHGIVAEADWPYEPSPWTATNHSDCGKPEAERPVVCWTNGDPSETTLAARRFTLPDGRWLNTNSIKAHMTARQQGVVVGLDFFYQSWNHRRSTLPVSADYFAQGYVTFPNDKDVQESHQHRAGHAILLVGWDDNLEVQLLDAEGQPRVDASGNPVVEKGFYIFKNSWGTGRFGVQNPHGDGYGFLSMKYVERYGSAYVSDLPDFTPPTPEPDPQATVEHYENLTSLDIPDNAPAGIASEIEVPTTGGLVRVTVTVDIAHTYIGDLTVRLVHGDQVIPLHAETGGSTDNLQKAYVLEDFAGAERGGIWRLEVADGASADTGTLQGWQLDVEL